MKGEYANQCREDGEGGWRESKDRGRVDEERGCKSVQGRRGGWLKDRGRVEYVDQYREDGGVDEDGGGGDG